MIDFNLSKDNQYFSQRNNRFFPESSCNTTSMVTALEVAGIPYPKTQGVQPEDALTQVSESKEFLDKRSKIGKWAESIPPRQIHELLSEATNKFVGKQVTKFRYNVTLQEIVFSILKGFPVVVSGRFTSYGHIVCVVGFKSKQNRIPQTVEEVKLEDIEGFYIDDPWGNYFTQYKDTRGNDIFFPVKDFDFVTREYEKNQKWAHMFYETKAPVVKVATSSNKIVPVSTSSRKSSAPKKTPAKKKSKE